MVFSGTPRLGSDLSGPATAQRTDDLRRCPPFPALRFLLLTGLRRVEVVALPWDWVDERCSRTHLDVLAALAVELERLGAHRYVVEHVASTAVGLARVANVVCGFDAWGHHSADEWDRFLGRRMMFLGRR